MKKHGVTASKILNSQNILPENQKKKWKIVLRINTKTKKKNKHKQ